MKGIGSGKVLESIKDDNVFLLYSDHGNDGLVAFPGKKYLYADQLQQALKDMHAKNIYNNLIYYLDASYSGSMLKTLPDDLNIYATTSANPHESSYGKYCGNEAKVNGTLIGACLGGKYSTSYITSSELHLEERQTLGEEYKFIQNMVKKSHPSEYVILL